jgi:hypothetical protein
MARTPGVGVGFWVRWSDVEPTSDPAWQLATKAKREEFRRAAEIKASSIWDARVSRGVGANDQPLAALSPTTIRYRRSAMGPAVKGAPPLTPARTLSRTRAWLRSRRTDEGVWFYWLKGSGKTPWATILQYHASGMVRGAPARDVIDFSPNDLAALKRWAAWWWRMHRARVVSQAATVRRTPERTILRVRVPDVPRPAKPVPPSPMTPAAMLDQLRRVTLSTGNESQVRRAIEQGTFSGFRRRK